MGRPREFDELKVLEAASDTFWTKGYQGTSTRDLTQATGLTQGSIYAAYGDKRGIFLKSLRHYLDSILGERIARLETSRSPGRAIAAFFAEIVDRSMSDSRHRGCMLVNTAIEATSDDPGLQQLVAEETALIEQFFHRCLLAGQRSGEIDPRRSADDDARHLLAVLLGLRVLARVRPDAALLEGLVRPALSALGISWFGPTATS
jgi:TetR/AcrR family transcriptional repressor of nem operon